MARYIMLMTAVVLAASEVTASAQNAPAMTVQSLLDQGATAVGVITSRVGPGIFLQNGHALVLCFVTEKPDTPTLDTFYCKPVK